MKLSLRRKQAEDGARTPRTRGPKVCGVLVGQRSLRVYAGGRKGAADGGAEAREIAIPDGKLAPTLQALWERGELGARVVVGLDPTLDFLSTARADDGDQIQAQSQLADRLAGRLPGGVASRENPTRGGKVKLKSLLFFPRRIGTAIFEGLRGLGRARVRVLSTTHVLYAQACKRKAAPRRWKSEIRVLVGEPETVALLVHRGVPVARQSVPTQEDGRAAALTGVLQRLAMMAQGDLGLGGVSGVVLHASDDDLAELRASAEALEVPVVQAAPVPCDRSALAAMLAGARTTGRQAPLELGSVLQVDGERPSFPWRPALPAAASLLFGAVYLWWEGSLVLEEVRQMEASIDALTQEREISREEIIDLRDGMGIEVGAAEAALVDRVYWSELILEIMRIMPENAWLRQLEGAWPYHYVPDLIGDDEDGEGGAPADTGPSPKRRWLKMQAYLEAGDDGEHGFFAVRDQLVESLRQNQTITAVFPKLDGTQISQQREGEDNVFPLLINLRPPGG